MSFRRQNQQPGSCGRKISNGTAGPAGVPPISGSNTNRTVPGRTRNTMKSPSQSSPVFEGVYNNTRMLHYLTAVVGSTCDVRVKSGNVYEGIFKTLSSRCELVVDAVHKRSEGGDGDGGGGGLPPSLPRIEDITDTMIFSPADLVTMTCRDVDLNYAIRDAFTDTAISSSRVNGEHREKVLQRWDGGDSNGEGFDLETDTSNGWDASEMFKFNEETYGVTSTYDSSLSMYTIPLERGSSDGFRLREARAARLANEIEGSPQYRHRASLENDDKTEEDKYSAVVRERDEGRERGSPGFQGPAGNREGKYIPLPQRAREMGVSPNSLRGRDSGPMPNRTGGPGNSSRPVQGSDRSSPLSGRGAYSPHQSQASPPAQPSSPTSAASSHPVPHSLSHPQALADATRSINGVSSRTSPKDQRAVQTNRTLRTPSSQSSPAVSRSPKPDDPALAGPAYLDTSSSSVSSTTPKSSGPTPLFPVDVNEILNSAAKERTEGSASPQEGKSGKVPSVQQRTQLEELRKFGKEFRVSVCVCVCGSLSFHPILPQVKPSPAPTPPRPTPPSASVLLQPPPGQQAIYSTPYLSYLSPVQIQGHSVQVCVQCVNMNVCEEVGLIYSGQVVGPRPDHHGSSQPQMLQATASAAGPSLVASPYPQAYLQYSQVIQGMPHYPGQPVYSMLQGGARMLTQAGHPQALGPPGPQYPGQSEGPPGPQQAMYAPQQFSHHSGSMHPPQPSSTPTGSQPPPQHTAPSPGHGQSGQGGPQPQTMYHSGPLSAPTPPNMPPGHSSPQGSYPMQGYSLPTHQPMAQHYPGLGQLTQAHVAQGMSGPHHQGGHGPPQMMLHYAGPPQQGPGPAPQHGPPPQQGAHQHYYIQHPQAVQVQAHPTQQLSFHPPGN
uniref:LsmAD domain-containing protein n=1 Tax=Esox lucius TaxID=8010 RepID=A0A6Q2ZQ87_ESOLU